MTGITNHVDSTSLYFASIVSKNGRNEVLIFPIEKDTSLGEIKTNQVVKIELEAEDTVVDAMWIDAPAKRGKKRAKDDKEMSNFETSEAKLVVLLISGDFIFFSPGVDKIVNRIAHGSKFTNLVGLNDGESIWAYSGEEEKFVEFSVVENKVIKETKFNRKIGIAKGIKYKGSKITARSVPVVVESTGSLEVVDVAKSKNQVVVEFGNPSHSTNAYKVIRQSQTHPERIIALRKNSNELQVFNISNVEDIISLRANSEILNFLVVSTASQEQIFAFTTTNVEVYNIDYNTTVTDVSAASIIKTSSAGIPLSAVVYDQDENQLIGVWYDLLEPRFIRIASDISFEGLVEIPIEYHERSQNAIVNGHSEIAVHIPKEVTVDNLSAQELHQTLTGLLTTEEVNSSEVIFVCSTNDNENNIKQVLKMLSTESTDLLLRVFELISSEVAKDPSKNTPLSKWLKLLLLGYGGAIAKESLQSENLKNLQSGLNNGIKLLPHLLALQGRLQLLKSQSELRSRISTLNIETNDDIEDDNDNESIVYANGENDENDISKFIETELQDTLAEEVEEDDDDE